MMNAGDMNEAQRAARGGLSVLSLQVELAAVPPGGDVVRVLVDGQDLGAAINPGWHAFSPREMLSPPSPLLPTDRKQYVAEVRHASKGLSGEAGR